MPKHKRPFGCFETNLSFVHVINNISTEKFRFTMSLRGGLNMNYLIILDIYCESIGGNCLIFKGRHVNKNMICLRAVILCRSIFTFQVQISRTHILLLQQTW